MVRTRVGYAGGAKQNPTYHSLGGHTEAIQVDFDPAVTPYAELLDIFWASHNPSARAWSSQYKAVLWVHDDAQRATAERTRDALAAAKGIEVHTEILDAPTFWRAEDYHQKYRLRGYDKLEDRVRRLCETEVAFVDSTLAARLNAVLAGYPVEVEDPRLTEDEREILRAAHD